MNTDANNTNASRTTVYAFGAAVLAVTAYYVKAEAEEVALWQILLGASIPFGALVMATARTWPKRSRVTPDA